MTGHFHSGTEWKCIGPNLLACRSLIHRVICFVRIDAANLIDRSCTQVSGPLFRPEAELYRTERFRTSRSFAVFSPLFGAVRAAWSCPKQNIQYTEPNESHEARATRTDSTRVQCDSRRARGSRVSTECCCAALSNPHVRSSLSERRESQSIATRSNCSSSGAGRREVPRAVGAP